MESFCATGRFFTPIAIMNVLSHRLRIQPETISQLKELLYNKFDRHEKGNPATINFGH